MVERGGTTTKNNESSGVREMVAVIIGMVIVLGAIATGRKVASIEKMSDHNQVCIELLIALDSIPLIIVEHCTEEE